MKRKVWLTLTGTQVQPDGSRDTNRRRCAAECLALEDGACVIEYRETEEAEAADETDTAAGDAGEQRGVPCRLEIRPGLLQLEKSGTAGTLLVMEAGKRHACRYETPCGTIPMETLTSRVVSRTVNGHLHVRAQYHLFPDPEYAPEYAVECSVQIKMEPFDLL